jgi:hypothetical protein
MTNLLWLLFWGYFSPTLFEVFSQRVWSRESFAPVLYYERARPLLDTAVEVCKASRFTSSKARQTQAARHGWDTAVEVRKASRFTSSKAWQTQAARHGCQEVDDKEEDCGNCLSGRHTSELGTGQISSNSAAPWGTQTSQENQNTRSHLTCPPSAS